MSHSKTEYSLTAGFFKTLCSNTTLPFHSSLFYSSYNSASLNALPLLEYDFFLPLGFVEVAPFTKNTSPLYIHPTMFFMDTFPIPLLWSPTVL